MADERTVAILGHVAKSGHEADVERINHELANLWVAFLRDAARQVEEELQGDAPHPPSPRS